jgi:hypothetical protein
VIQELFQNNVLRIVESKRDDVMRRFTNSAPPNTIRIIKSGWMRLAGHKHIREEKCIQNFGGKPKGKTPLGRCRHSYEYNVKTDLKRNEIGGYGLNVALDRNQWWLLVNIA